MNVRNINTFFVKPPILFEVQEEKGKGAFGIVKKAKWLNKGETIAIKIQNITSQIQYHMSSLEKKENAKKYVNQQIVVEEELLKLTKQFRFSFRKTNSTGNEEHYFGMSYLEGQKIKEVIQTLSLQQKIMSLLQIVKQVQFIHEHDYVHLDIWPDNILLNVNDHCITTYLHDYGCAAKITNGIFLSKLKGSHISPEVIAADQGNEICIYSFYSDIYALGMSFYELLHNSYYDFELDKNMIDFRVNYSRYYQAVLNSLAKKQDKISKILECMICLNPDKRLSIQEVSTQLELTLIFIDQFVAKHFRL